MTPVISKFFPLRYEQIATPRTSQNDEKIRKFRIFSILYRALREFVVVSLQGKNFEMARLDDKIYMNRGF